MEHFIGCDVHTRNQVVAWIDEETGEIKKRRLEHESKEVKEFYAQFPRGTVVGIEATFPAHLGTVAGRARPAAVAGASDEAGAGAHAGEESTARTGHQPGSVPEEQAVEREGKEGA